MHWGARCLVGLFTGLETGLPQRRRCGYDTEQLSEWAREREAGAKPIWAGDESSLLGSLRRPGSQRGSLAPGAMAATLPDLHEQQGSGPRRPSLPSERGDTRCL